MTDMKLLHIDSSVLGPNSVSRQVSAAIVQHLTATKPALAVTYRDLAAAPLEHFSGEHLAARQGVASDAALSDDVAAGTTALDDFLAADTVVIGAPMYNFTIPTQLKAWIDRIAVVGKTFSYGPEGVKGHAGGKRMIIALSRGGFYGAGAPSAIYEHTETYLRGVFGFLGVTDIEVIVAEGINLGPEHREKAISSALQAATNLRAA
jgi:FMN-dependent NADH-azoreductase